MLRKNRLNNALEQIKRLPTLDYSESTLGDKEIPFIICGAFNKIDISKTTGHIEIRSCFTNLLDASGAHDLILILEGNFNVVDLSGAKNVILNLERANVNILDRSEES